VKTCWCVSEKEQVKVLRWARELGCPWDWRMCAYAAGGGHLDVLRWAQEHDCLWNAWTCEYAAGADTWIC
jgi:hypothetical protein